MPPQIRPGRILLVQDRPQSLEHQKKMFAKAAGDLKGALELETFDLRYPPARLVHQLEGGEWYDWMVTDLIEDGVDQSPADCAGVRLIQALSSHGLFFSYKHLADVVEPSGVRNIAICSVLVGEGSAPDAKLLDKLEDLGVKADWFARGGDVLPLARRICETLRLEGALGSGQG